MPVCPACTSSQRESIDAALLAGRRLGELSDEVGLPVSTLAGHRAQHLWSQTAARRPRPQSPSPSPSPSSSDEAGVRALLAEMTRAAQPYEAADAAAEHHQHKGGDKT